MFKNKYQRGQDFSGIPHLTFLEEAFLTAFGIDTKCLFSEATVEFSGVFYSG